MFSAEKHGNSATLFPQVNRPGSIFKQTLNFLKRIQHDAQTAGINEQHGSQQL